MLIASPLVVKAAHFAQSAHAGQVRKYTGLPYFTHTYDVAKLVSTVTSDPEMIAAALLHDTLENTDTAAMEILTEFGERVHSLVLDLTDVYTDASYGNRARRKAQEAERLAQVAADAQTIKLADLIDNSRSIVALDVNFARTYLREKELYLSALTRGHSTLFTQAQHILRGSLAAISLKP